MHKIKLTISCILLGITVSMQAQEATSLDSMNATLGAHLFATLKTIPIGKAEFSKRFMAIDDYGLIGHPKLSPEEKAQMDSLADIGWIDQFYPADICFQMLQQLRAGAETIEWDAVSFVGSTASFFKDYKGQVIRYKDEKPAFKIRLTFQYKKTTYQLHGAYYFPFEGSYHLVFAQPKICTICTGSNAPVTLDQIGIHLTETLKQVNNGELDYDKRFMPLEKIRAISTLDTLPVMKKTLERIARFKAKVRKTQMVKYYWASTFKIDGELVDWSAIEYKDHTATYFVDKDPLRSEEKYGDDLPGYNVTLTFNYKDQDYKAEAFYFKYNSDCYLVYIKSSIQK